MNQVIGNNEIYYMFTCPRMFYFFLQDETDNVVVENALENDRIRNVKDYFKNISWVDAKKNPEITKRTVQNEADILNPILEGSIKGIKLKLAVHALIRKKDKYHIVISHLSRRPSKRHHVIASSFIFLAKLNGLSVSDNIIFLRKKSMKTQKIKEDGYLLFLKTFREIAKSQEPPAATGTRICNFCGYWEKCHSFNVDDRTKLPVSSIRGIGANMSSVMKSYGINTLGDLIDIPLRNELEEKIKNIRRYKLQAYSYVKDTALFLTKPDLLITNNDNNGVYFDIEADDNPYLFGFLQNDQYQYFLINDNDSRKSQIEDIIKYVEQLKVNLYHYCEYENRVLRELSNELKQQFKNEGNGDLKNKFLKSFFETPMIDVYEIIIKNVFAPLRHYSLKSIAKWLGFKWRIGLDGRSSIQEYRRWLNTGNKKHLEALLLYNEDDCRATQVVKEWISNPSSYNHKHIILNRRDVDDILKRK